uniref:Uncharacterized protein n=1 Tax=Mucochytrium quahogii TaxID=96639 RepID=A0A7S2RP66_9STRA|mmetsp:Transcript_5948/g.9285  ORF Transcript_5948/g.9285 Transcript_5948/m.9285 type:complete len:293 (-) Transcript_5948:479-1357(-)|eukprot:CAMPEP_0203744516 /NCGR_PEP_ID=MMETSP0098-20131031/559_1 /ASSEMBLY_ACC=CAM_ASM_000208 /TAXON_ID=96639 /ORGANISM=" , Strain NY0313808BC1" /LENGTH=292 /DNA_ID=CAMNT_0050632053 /DNA_START=393 /DNA_END=1271 /DNA_ORIENTATION=-
MLFELLQRICKDRPENELQREYSGLGAHSPYQETRWGEGSHATMMKDNKCEDAHENIYLNRFNNILPFDSHLLKCSKGYINASIVSPLDQKYIITQGPLCSPDTREAFWCAVLENNVSLIVNLAPFGEECADYLPPMHSCEYPVQIINEEVQDNKVICREIHIGDHHLEHIQFNHWPNYSLPLEAETLASVVRLAHSKRKDNRGETLVHCSGGVGRSGTFVTTLATWQALQDIAENNTLSHSAQDLKPKVVGLVKTAVETIRDQRHPWAVEGVNQYGLIFTILGQLAENTRD